MTMIPSSKMLNLQNKNTRVLLVESQSLIRAGLHAVLSRLSQVQVVAEAGEEKEALQLATQVHPNIALISLIMPNFKGLELISRFKHHCPEMQGIILSPQASEEVVRQAFRAGISGYLSTDAEEDELAHVIQCVVQGKLYLSQSLSQRLSHDYLEQLRGHPEVKAPLTHRQREVLQYIAEGKSTKEIAYLLGRSVKTIETHRTQVMKRLQIHDISNLVRYAIRTGIIPLDA